MKWKRGKKAQNEARLAAQQQQLKQQQAAASSAGGGTAGSRLPLAQGPASCMPLALATSGQRSIGQCNAPNSSAALANIPNYPPAAAGPGGNFLQQQLASSRHRPHQQRSPTGSSSSAGENGNDNELADELANEDLGEGRPTSTESAASERRLEEEEGEGEGEEDVGQEEEEDSDNSDNSNTSNTSNNNNRWPQ